MPSCQRRREMMVMSRHYLTKDFFLQMASALLARYFQGQGGCKGLGRVCTTPAEARVDRHGWQRAAACIEAAPELHDPTGGAGAHGMAEVAFGADMGDKTLFRALNENGKVSHAVGLR